MMGMRVLSCGQQREWDEVLRGCRHDAYHLSQYHALAAANGEGEARLFAYAEGDYQVAMPLLLRDLRTVPGLDQTGDGWRDATSVYGYAGPVASHEQIPPDVLGRFRLALTGALSELGVIAAFSRLHPLLPQVRLLDSVGECAEVGQTVSLDLTLPSAERQAGYCRSHRHSANALRRRGAACVHDGRGESLDRFTAIYHETMRRVEASSGYFFSRDYLAELLDGLGSHAHLFSAVLDGEVMCGALVLVCGDIAQFHLSGTGERHLKAAPTKFLVDGIAEWGTERGLKALHLGGGVGAANDSLFSFKAGFSDRRHTFRTWRWILRPVVYAQLCAAVEQTRAAAGQAAVSPDFFPAYRCPAAPRTENEKRPPEPSCGHGRAEAPT